MQPAKVGTIAAVVVCVGALTLCWCPAISAEHLSDALAKIGAKVKQAKDSKASVKYRPEFNFSGTVPYEPGGKEGYARRTPNVGKYSEKKFKVVPRISEKTGRLVKRILDPMKDTKKYVRKIANRTHLSLLSAAERSGKENSQLQTSDPAERRLWIEMSEIDKRLRNPHTRDETINVFESSRNWLPPVDF